MDHHQSAEVKAFLAEVVALERKHGLSISHEDGHGGFIIEGWSESNEKWLLDAADQSTKGYER